MNIGQLKQLIKDLDDEVEVLIDISVGFGRCIIIGSLTDNVEGEYYSPDEVFGHLDCGVEEEEDEEGNNCWKSNVFVLTCSGEEDWSSV